MSRAASTVDRAAVLRQHRDHVNRGFANLATLVGLPVEVRSAGALVYDETDVPYLDCGGYGVFLLGHRHPRVVDAVTDQLGRHPLATRGLLEPTLARAATALTSVAPEGLDHVCFTNSGAEAIELALKLAKANGRHRVISTEGGFHGKTLGAVSVTGHRKYREGLGALLPGVEFVPYGDLDAMRAALDGVPGSACALLEPVQGEGGVRIPEPGYLSDVRSLCDRAGALLLVDEVQSGLGRLGTWWGCDIDGVRPDVLTVGKVLSGGVVPVAATLATAEVFEVLNRDPLLHSSTYAGNPLAAAAAAATIEVLHDDKLVERSRELGARLLPEVRAALAPAGQTVRAVRGRGLLIGIELASAQAAVMFLTAMLRERVLTSYTLNSSEVIRLTPPAVLTSHQVTWLLKALRAAAVQLAAS